ncbi:beta-phosphoglucomutase [uncultured Alistipes sp.]|jgi:beta-phosphoglucomutase|uniref:beta-phosphoglucomutase n=1 Tax=uncultured Alistipes sp. TaxID=538949 RepID=UPI0025FC4F1B|nr:beta-phosphoglucomutase [uncultured Alistipes sp.]
MIRCCLFDLDGVIVDTARFHYLAWAEMARELGFEFTPEQGEATKGVSRMASLDIVLRAGGLKERFTHEEKERMAAEKNARYLAYVAQMTPADVLPGVRAFLESLPAHGVKVVLGSASRNAGEILDRCALRDLFDAIVDGTLVTKAKPDPEVFALGARLVHEDPPVCVVFEDAAAGVEAATRAGMRSVGIGGSPALAAATMQLETFEGFTFGDLVARIDRY